MGRTTHARHGHGLALRVACHPKLDKGFVHSSLLLAQETSNRQDLGWLPWPSDQQLRRSTSCMSPVMYPVMGRIHLPSQFSANSATLPKLYHIDSAETAESLVPGRLCPSQETTHPRQHSTKSLVRLVIGTPPPYSSSAAGPLPRVTSGSSRRFYGRRRHSVRDTSSVRAINSAEAGHILLFQKSQQ
jgi:hypothetical protein